MHIYLYEYINSDIYDYINVDRS